MRSAINVRTLPAQSLTTNANHNKHTLPVLSMQLIPDVTFRGASAMRVKLVIRKRYCSLKRPCPHLEQFKNSRRSVRSLFYTIHNHAQHVGTGQDPGIRPGYCITRKKSSPPSSRHSSPPNRHPGPCQRELCACDNSEPVFKKS